MKKIAHTISQAMLLTLIFLAMSARLALSQNQFIIGAEWLNKPEQPTGQPHIPTVADWQQMSSLGLNWGVVVYSTKIDNEITTYNSVLTALQRANSVGMKLAIDRYVLSGASRGQRWEYHPEYSGQFFQSNLVGLSVDDENADWYPDDQLRNSNCRRVLAGTHQAGFLAKDLLNGFNTEQRDSTTYYLKVRMRLPLNTPLDSTPVVIVKAVRTFPAHEKVDTVWAYEFSGYDYETIKAFSFVKKDTGNFVAGSPQEYGLSLQPLVVVDSIPYALNRPDMENRFTTSTAFDYQVYWPGSVNCFLDQVIVDDSLGNDTFSGSHDAAINAEVDLFKNEPALSRFKIRDEPRPGEWPAIGHTEEVIQANVGLSGKTGMHYNIAWSDIPALSTILNMNRRNMQWTKNLQTITESYPYSADMPLPEPDPSMYLQAIQGKLQWFTIEKVLQPAITTANQYEIPMWFTTQAHKWVDPYKSDSNNWREPTTFELKMVVNLSLAYGAKGIIYFMYQKPPSSIDGEGLVNENDGSPRTIIYSGTSYEGNKWTTLTSLNQQLSTLGPTLVNLTWQDAFSRHLLTGPFTKFNLSVGGNLTNVTSGEADSQTYVEVGWLRDVTNGIDYLMVVNRRTAPGDSRNITLKFNNAGSREITDVASGRIWVIPPSGSFEDGFSPGDGRLYRVQDAVWSGTKQITSDVIVPAEATLTINPGTDITFSPGATLIVHGNLSAEGTGGSHISFDGLGYSPPTSEPDYWKLALLRFKGSGSGTIKYVDFKDGKYQLFSESTGSLDIENCSFVNFGFTGGSGGFGGNAVEIFYDISSPPLAMGTLLITNNTFSGTTKLGYGIVVANVQPSTMTITDNSVQDCYMGILAHKMAGTIGANTITGCANGIVANSQSPTFTSLTASGNDKSFFLENGSTATITNCTINGINEQGIYVKTGAVPQILSNTISSSTSVTGVYAVDAGTHVNIFSNQFSIPYGVVIDNGAAGTIGQNVSGSGGNTFTNGIQTIEIRSLAGAVNIRHNTLSQATGGYGVYTSAAPLIENNIIEYGNIGISVLGQTPTTISMNEIRQSDRGIYLGSTSTPPTSGSQWSQNNLTNNTWNIWNSSTSTVSVPNNWWGICPTSDIGTKMFGSVAYEPFLTQPAVGTGPYSAGTGGAGCPSNDLVAHWALEGNLSDGSGNNNGAQGVGVSYATGVVGQGLQLSGGTGNFAYAADQAYYHITNPTVQAWIKPSSVGTAMTIISEDIQGAWADGRGFFMDVNGGNARFIVGNAAGWKVATGATSLQAGTWYHVAGVYDGASVKIYLNGQLDGSNSIGAVTISYNPITTAGPNPSTYYIGINHNATYSAPTYEPHLAYPFQGIIDEVRMYNRPLSASEIQQYYNETVPPATITVASPNGGESFSGGGQTNILWSSQSVSQNVKIEYSTDAGSNWTLIVSDLQNSGTYTWTIPSISSTQCKVRVSAMTGSPTDQSDGLFTILTGDPSLVAHWKFEGNLNDESTSNHPLTGVGTSYTTGQTGQGLSLSGTNGSFAHATDETYYHPSNPSVEAWIKMQGTSEHVSILTESIQGAWADGRGFFLDVLNGKARFVIGSAGWKVAQSAATLQLDTWYHVVGTYDVSTLKIYVNGQLDGSNNIGTVNITYASMANAGPNPSTMYVGIQHSSANSAPTATSDLYFPFQGVIDEVRIYNRALSATEVQQHYTGFFGKRAYQDTSKVLPPAIAENVPREFGLFQNHPNPFNPETVIRYAVPVQSHVTLRVYDVLGRLVKTLVSTSLKDGFHSVTWDGRDENGRYLSSGVYLCHMMAWGETDGHQNRFADTRKLILNK